MKAGINILFLWLLICLGGGPVYAGDPLQLYDISRQKVVALHDMLHRLTNGRIVVVGEHHTDPAHHDAQLQIIKAVAETGVPVAVGLEMFRADSQKVLDRWIAGTMEEKAFQKAYDDNWGFSWDLYRDIFQYARDQKIPLVGLNVPREITRQVAREGFDSLSPEQRKNLPFVECVLDPEYMEFVKRAHGAHAHGQMNFNYFCEAQLVWDKAMAVHALEFLKAHPDYMIIILAGTGHAWKKGIPEQLRQQSPLVCTVVLPEVPGASERGQVALDDADYLVLSSAE